jgi:acetyl-CoA carboxylase biotin carboxylase subunit
MRRALHEYVVTGVNTLLPLHRDLSEAEDVVKGEYDIHWLEKWLASKAKAEAA